MMFRLSIVEECSLFISTENDDYFINSKDKINKKILIKELNNSEIIIINIDNKHISKYLSICKNIKKYSNNKPIVLN